MVASRGSPLILFLFKIIVVASRGSSLILFLFKIIVVSSRGSPLILFLFKIIVVTSRGSSLIFLPFTAFQLGLMLVIGGEHVFMTSNPMLCCDAFNEDFSVSSDHYKNKLRETHV